MPFDWFQLLNQDEDGFKTANVSSFKHAPMTEFWDRLVTVGIKVEVVNTDVDEETIRESQLLKQKQQQQQQAPFSTTTTTTTSTTTTTKTNPPASQLTPSKKKQIQPSNKSSSSSIGKSNSNSTQHQAPLANCGKSNNNSNNIKQEPSKLNNTGNNSSHHLINKNEKVYWIATVIKVYGYLAKLRYEGYEDDSSHDFWVYLFNDDVIHGVGWCASQGKTLVPPKNILRKLPDWTMYLIKKLTGSRTLPHNFNELIADSLKTRFKKGMKLEVVDKNRVSSVRVATVELAIGGRLLVTYDGAEAEEAGFWTHEKSSLVHPIGWAQFVSHELVATYEYARESLEKVNTKKFALTDATWDMFDLPTNELPNNTNERFETHMKLEAIDPLNLSSICVASVIKVLRANYLMIGIDGSMCPTGSDWFCFHATSPYIFPPGFCKANNIELSNPDNDKNFDWKTYMEKHPGKLAPESLFNMTIPEHGFKEGMMIEAVDLMQSRLVCVATITRIVGRLLRIHFNGWDESFDQWCDCESPDLFPIGWCELVGYPLEPPKSEELSEASSQQRNNLSNQRRLNQTPGDNQKRRKSSIKKGSGNSSKKKKVKSVSLSGKKPTTTTSSTTKTTTTTGAPNQDAMNIS